MNVNVTNYALSVGSIELIGISSASLLQIGDTDSIKLYSYFDTPPESVIVGALAPLPSPSQDMEEAETVLPQGGGTAASSSGSAPGGYGPAEAGGTVYFSPADKSIRRETKGDETADACFRR